MTERLRADPHDVATALDLAHALGRLRRDLELVALTSARIEEGTEAEREAMLPIRASALGRLATAARAAGRTSEAELYESMLR